MPFDQPLVPEAIRRTDNRLEITWEQGHVGSYSLRALRLACPCARCVDELTSRVLLDPDSVAADLRLDSIRPVGSYAVRFGWSDGHASGIYTYKLLRELCPCAACSAGG